MTAAALEFHGADALVSARAYAGSDAMGAVLDLLRSLEDRYKADLEHVSADNLVRLQTALRQVASLRKALTTESNTIDPKIL